MELDGQITKLEMAERLALDASKSGDIDRRLGGFLIYSGIVDFIAIQAARLIEQIILKSELADGKQPSFQPKEDDYFYDQHISTRAILKGIRNLLPFNSASEPERAKTITDLARQMVGLGLRFLQYRNPIVHSIGDPRRKFEGIVSLCDNAIVTYGRFREAHTAFFTAAAPYRFSEKELQYFYGRRVT